MIHFKRAPASPVEEWHIWKMSLHRRVAAVQWLIYPPATWMTWAQSQAAELLECNAKQPYWCTGTGTIALSVAHLRGRELSPGLPRGRRKY